MLRWFSGGTERCKNAIDLLECLSKSLDANSQSYIIVDKYLKELKSPDRPIPYILSAFHLEMSKAIQQDNISLDKKQSQILEKLRKISDIRYGGNI